MTLLRVALASFVFASGTALACTAATDDTEPSGIDAGVDVTAAPPPPPYDAGTPDGARPEVRPAPRLTVSCAKDPCYVAVSGSGSEHICGLLSDGTVRCWGRDTRFRAQSPADGGEPQADGALGRGRIVSMLEGGTPAPVAGLSDVTQISVGSNLGTCARTGDGSVYCWGRNEFGQLGRPTIEAQLPVPTRVEGLPPVASVALGAQTACAVASADGSLYCWGSRTSQIAIAADKDASPEFPPQRFSVFRSPVQELTIATCPRDMWTPYADTIVALLDGGVLATLGEFPVTESHPSAPTTPLPFELPSVARVGAFAYLTRDGLLSRWMPDSRALYVPHPANVVDVTIACGREATPFGKAFTAQAGVLLSTGRLFRWGLNTAGALGYPAAELDIATEALDMTHVAGERVVSFATTLGSTCVSNVDGEVSCWGSNQYGELGRGTVDADNHPEAEVIR